MTGAEDEVHEALSDELARLTGNGTFTTIAEFGADALPVVWRVHRDEHGTPRAQRLSVSAAALRDPDAFYRAYDPAFIVRTSDVLSGELLALLHGASQIHSASQVQGAFQAQGARLVPVYECRVSLEEQLREAIRTSPLELGYELAVLSEVPRGRPDAGRLELTGHPLFPMGASHGDQVTVRVRCAPTDGHGTTFAVVTRDPRPNVPPKDRELRPVQLQTAPVPPGTSELTVELARPGRVVFHGLPAEFGKPVTSPDELRSGWADIRRRIPERLVRTEPVHLVCLVEVSGGDERLHLRIDRLVKLVTEAEAAIGRLVVSVVAYGPHSVAWAVDEEPISVRTWAATSERAEQELQGLAVRRPDEREYLRAAQLECALAWLARYLSDADGRPVLVTAGGRPPHPHRMDPRTQLIPCPDRVNWKPQVDRLSELGTVFGALRDRQWRGDIWQALGQKVMATVDDPVDMPDFAAALGLREQGQSVPLPFID
jgi:hypothetical protein